MFDLIRYLAVAFWPLSISHWDIVYPQIYCKILRVPLKLNIVKVTSLGKINLHNKDAGIEGLN